jgi:hypothetical protein
MPIILNADSNASSVAILFRDYADKFPKDLATALSRTASGAKKQLIAETPDYIDRPTPFTLRGFYSKGANSKDLSAEVGTINPFFKKHHMRPQVDGGDRAVKGSERRMRAKGFLAATEFLAPGPAMHLDQYGNMKGSNVVQILSQIRSLSLKGESGFEGNRAEGESSKAFFGIINGHKGVWERRGRRNIRLMMQVVGKPSYSPRFPMVEIVQQYFNANIEREFWKAYEEGKAIRARKGM